jgi:serine protease Do
MQLTNALSRTRKAVAVVALSALAMTVVSITHVPTQAQAQTSMPAAQSLPDFRSLVRDNQLSVVNIFTTRKVRTPSIQMMPFGMRVPPGDSPHDRQGETPNEQDTPEFFKRFGQGRIEPREHDANSLGSGFIVSSNGLILTNAHVVDGADEIKVKLHDRTEKDAKLIGMDKQTDVAVLKIDATNLPAVKIGNSEKIEVGEWVLAIGSPFSMEYTATHGIVSALGRRLDSNYVPFIQTDVPVNPGNSGGPLFNLRGEVVGINSQIYSRTGGYMGLSFAIPINIARDVQKQLEAHGKVVRGWLGVSIQSVNSDLAKTFGLDKPTGALVGDVTDKSPAAKAGVKNGDVIIEYNNQTIDDSGDLPPLVASTPIGKSVPLKVLRDGKQMMLDLKVAELPGDKDSKTASDQDHEGKPLLNIQVSDVPEQLRERLGVKSGGVLVQQVNSGPAQKAGIEQGDVIVKVDSKEITDASQFIKLVKGLPRGKPIAMLVRSQQGNQRFVAVTLAKE